MVERSGARRDTGSAVNRQALTFALSGLAGPCQVVVDLSRASASSLTVPRSVPAVQIDAGIGASMSIAALRVQPQRIALDIVGAPSLLTLTLQVDCREAFLFGWLQVAEGVRSSVSTSVERLSLAGPGYWAVPVWAPAGPGAEPAQRGGERAAEMASLTHQRQAVRASPASEDTVTVKPGKDGKPTP